MEWVVGEQYNQAWKAVIRPPRNSYSVEELGPVRFNLGKSLYKRTDLRLKSPRGHMLECSHFLPARIPEEKQPCVVYLHGNSSSRLEALSVLPLLLPLDVSIFCLDLSGSGRSQGDYVSLGHNEEEDLCTALEYLRQLSTVTSIGLWGRSMGAATAIMRAAKDSKLAACVLDSPFSDLRTLAAELVGQVVTLPKFLVDIGLEVVRSEIQSRAGFDPDLVLPIKCAPRARCPALFGAAEDDSIVTAHHAQVLHNAWGGPRTIRLFSGDHNSERPAWFLAEASQFLADKLYRRTTVVPRREQRRRSPHAGSKEKDVTLKHEGSALASVTAPMSEQNRAKMTSNTRVRSPSEGRSSSKRASKSPCRR